MNTKDICKHKTHISGYVTFSRIIMQIIIYNIYIRVLYKEIKRFLHIIYIPNNKQPTTIPFVKNKPFIARIHFLFFAFLISAKNIYILNETPEI